MRYDNNKNNKQCQLPVEIAQFSFVRFHSRCRAYHNFIGHTIIGIVIMFGSRRACRNRRNLLNIRDMIGLCDAQGFPTRPNQNTNFHYSRAYALDSTRRGGRGFGALPILHQSAGESRIHEHAHAHTQAVGVALCSQRQFSTRLPHTHALTMLFASNRVCVKNALRCHDMAILSLQPICACVRVCVCACGLFGRLSHVHFPFSIRCCILLFALHRIVLAEHGAVCSIFARHGTA